ncbi:hypothetical protein ACVME8_008766 [Bradyrhizobium diazoefficiens]
MPEDHDGQCSAPGRLADRLPGGRRNSVWLWARPEASNSVDVLFIGDAAQMSRANVLAVSQAARSIVLLGASSVVAADKGKPSRRSRRLVARSHSGFSRDRSCGPRSLPRGNLAIASAHLRIQLRAVLGRPPASPSEVGDQTIRSKGRFPGARLRILPRRANKSMRPARHSLNLIFIACLLWRARQWPHQALVNRAARRLGHPASIPRAKQCVARRRHSLAGPAVIACRRRYHCPAFGCRFNRRNTITLPADQNSNIASTQQLLTLERLNNTLRFNFPQLATGHLSWTAILREGFGRRLRQVVSFRKRTEVLDKVQEAHYIISCNLL